ncbi:MAG TPA: cobaltochelatase subunit CobN [Geminicoccaceae bacterium]|nr:cobaltochelatase subunit CobN [Geminicoccaceae bacterium]
MHLLNARTTAPQDADEAVDLGQSPGDIVVLSAADTELACLAAAQARRPTDAPSLRLANLLRLGHPMSVDLHVERVIAPARLVILRLLGGRSYWPYGLEQVAGACRANGIPLAVLPGDDSPDAELSGWNTLPAETCHRLWQYAVHGGLDNAQQLLAYAASLLGRDEPWREPAPLLRAGLYWPGLARPDLAAIRARWQADWPAAALVFYRALVQAGDLAVIDGLIEALQTRGLNPLPVFTASLRDAQAGPLVRELLEQTAPDVVLNATGFAVSSLAERRGSPLDVADRPVLQLVLAGGSHTAWRTGTRGLSPRDLAMNVALPEVDGRILSRAVGFKTAQRFDERTETGLVAFEPAGGRIGFVAELAAAWARLARTPAVSRRVAIVLANYPNRDGRIANGVGLDTPASTVRLLQALRGAGYRIENLPAGGQALIEALLAGVTNDLAARAGREVRVRLRLADYRRFFARLPEAVQRTVEQRWGAPEDDPHVADGAFGLALLPLGNVVVGIQPARGYNVDPSASYHDPDLPPPHAYLAFYAWLRERFGSHAIIHMGKHGNLEWLPGKALALSEDCFPEAALGPLPHVYPFIVNDPGEGSQAKRRAAAVIVDHLTPPLTRAESYGPLAALEGLVDEYYDAAGVDPRRVAWLRDQILAQSRSLGLDCDIGIRGDDNADDALARLDNHLCELKELQIRDGLHVFGTAPAGEQLTDLLAALVRAPRKAGEGGDASLLRALARDLALGFDPLDCPMAEPWSGPRPTALAEVSAQPWRSHGDTLERLELLGRALIAGECLPEPAWAATRAVLDEIAGNIRPALAQSGDAEIRGVLAALDGRFVEPGPSGAPTRGRLDVLPTGRNFFSVDSRAVPTAAAWHLGWKSAALLVERFLQEHGDWPRTVALSAWGTANMRTGGDDVAQALALIGARPVWDAASHRVTGIEVLPADLLDRPRVDVTLRVSGFFRDAFPAQIELFDHAVREVAARDEPDDVNPIAARVRQDAAALRADGVGEADALRRAAYRVFGSKPGAYGAGLQALIDERGWESDADLARAYLAWGGYAYGARAEGIAEHRLFERRLGAVELVLHNQDNREHDILDSDDYYQFEGGLAAAVRTLSGEQPAIYHNDHSRPETPRINTLKEEVGRIVRARAANPKWIAGVMRHGYKGAFEIAATVDYLFAFAATAKVVEHHHFDALYDAYLADERVRGFMADANPAALREIAERFQEAIDRGLWRPARNSAHRQLEVLRTGDA